MRADRRFRGSQLRQRGLPRVSRRAAPERYGCLERWRVLPYMQDIPLRIQGVLLESSKRY
jgi:hypothetical protein